MNVSYGIGLGIFALSFTATTAIDRYVIPDPFMVVHRMDVQDGQVFFERTIVPPSAIADWSAVVVPDGREGPVCEGHGWDEYTIDEGTLKVMDLPVFVGSDCQLTPGAYTLYAFWVPRDDRRTARAQTGFTVPDIPAPE